MSFILDALRKSEIERQRQHGPSIAELPGARVDRRPPWALAVIGALLALNVAVVLYFMLRDTGSVAPSSGPAVASAPATVTASAPPAATTPGPLPLDSGAASPGYAAPPGYTAATQAPPADATYAPAAPDPTLVPAQPTPSVTYGDDTAPPAPQAVAGLPELSMDLHIFAADSAKRAVFINGRRYTEGATIVEGPIVEEITREGAVLNYRGRRFLLPRL